MKTVKESSPISWRVTKVTVGGHYRYSYDTLINVEIELQGSCRVFIPTADDILKKIVGRYAGEKRQVTVGLHTHRLLWEQTPQEENSNKKVYVTFLQNDWVKYVDAEWKNDADMTDRMIG